MSAVLAFTGGLGIFLLGVVIMTGGLRAVAGQGLQRLLARFTRSPLSGALTGALSTAVLQSSSATTVAAVGFVGAGLLSFPQALGVVFGANLGTTMTGWLVALVGFKFKLGAAVLPLIFLGVLLRLFGRQRLADFGMALAGFGLIFVGIQAMQTAMAGLDAGLVLQAPAADTLWGRLRLVLLGLLFTLLTQSSSAGVAAALTALYTGTISFEQAAALVIGMDVGTTATALLATLGGSVEVRRTGYSHVVYNLLTALLALFLLTPYVSLLHWWAPGWLAAEPELALVGFHSGFNVLGVCLILPFARPFARLLERLVPSREWPVVQRLESRLLAEPAVALEAVRSSLNELVVEMCREGQCMVAQGSAAEPELAERWRTALQQVQAYLDRIHLQQTDGRAWALLNACLHALDHARRLNHRLVQVGRHGGEGGQWRQSPVLVAPRDLALQALEAVARVGEGTSWAALRDQLQQRSRQAEAQAEAWRGQVMQRVASGEDDARSGDDQLDALRWLRRTMRHLWRLASHLERAETLSIQGGRQGTGVHR